MTRVTLEPSSIVQYIPLLLPGGQPPSRAADALAALVHAINTTLDLEIVGITEDADETQNQSENAQKNLPEGWNARSPDFTLKYRDPASKETLIVKIMKIGNKTQIHAILEQAEKNVSMEISTTEFVSSSFFQDQNAASESLIHGYVSSDRLAEFITRYIKEVLQPLLPELNYDARQTSDSPPPRSTEAPQQAQSQSRLLDTQQETQPPSLHRPFNLPERQDNPLEIGRSDLDPFPNPFAGKSPIQPLNPGGGMYVGPGHPMFGGHPAQPGGVGGSRGRGGVLPPLGAPPGARFDPIVPFGAGGIGGFPGRGGPPRGGPFTGEPDNDEFLPPRFGGGQGRGGGPSFPDDMYM
ncbi:hypothetical protein FRB91_000127 [Serendipita sp. 411]|nr:hypothetical protein FRB91_000127 [Serendipita sp. 411]